MKEYFQAVKFLSATRKQNPPPYRVVTHTLKGARGISYTFDLYSSEKKVSDIPIIFLHGMTPLGFRDPRQVKICAILSSLGYTVYAPSVDGIRNLTLSHKHIDEFKAFCHMIDATPDFSSGNGYAFFAPSFSGGICLHTAAETGLSEKIKSICLVGTFSDFTKCCDYILHDPSADEYARWLILANFLPNLKIISSKIISALRIEILKFWMSTSGFELEIPAISLSKKEREKLEWVMRDPTFLKKHHARLLQGMKKNIKVYDLSEVVGNIHAAVLTLHGTADNVIPASESQNLHNMLLYKCKQSHLVISPLLNHANPEIDFRLFKQMKDLVSGLAFYFRHIR